MCNTSARFSIKTMTSITQKTKNRSLHICDCGLAGYRPLLEQQLKLCEKRRQNKIPDTVLIVEHPSVITLGVRQSANKLPVGRSVLEKQHIDVVETRRGGGITAHNPGQLVFYPILNLKELQLGPAEYIRTLEQIGIELLEQFGVRAYRKKGYPGLWFRDKKIASIGVRVSKSVTCHGMAINIQNDLGIFELFVPCGLDGVQMTSVLNETGRRHPMHLAKEKLSRLLTKHFSIPNEPRATNHSTGHLTVEPRRLPPWLKRPLPTTEGYNQTDNVLRSLGIETICTNANCPNKGLCWNKKTAAVLILGNVCTRKCGFCSLTCGKPKPPDTAEPQRLAEMAEQMKLKYLVITSVNRDDLPDGGAGHFRNCIKKVREKCPNVRFEILTPDFRNCQSRALEILRDVLPFVFAHNIETVASLYPVARAGGNYQLSLNLLKTAKQSYGQATAGAYAQTSNIQTKSSIMLGLGETDDEVEQTLKDLRNTGCDRITIGQYLKPSKNSLDVVEYIPPEKFDFWKQRATDLGFSWVQSEPFARSSYLAEEENTP